MSQFAGVIKRNIQNGVWQVLRGKDESHEIRVNSASGIDSE